MKTVTVRIQGQGNQCQTPGLRFQSPVGTFWLAILALSVYGFGVYCLAHFCPFLLSGWHFLVLSGWQLFMHSCWQCLTFFDCLFLALYFGHFLVLSGYPFLYF